MRIYKDLFEFIQLLNKHRVEYLIVGGYAVVAHGYNRFTGDLDVWIKISEENADKMMLVTIDYPIPPGIFSREHFLTKGPLKGGQFGNPPLRIDILNDVIGMQFDECYKNAMKKSIEGEEFLFIDFDDLIKAKNISGRPQDKADVYALEKIKRRINKK